MRTVGNIVCVIGSAVLVLTAQLTGFPAPAAQAQENQNPFAGKALAFEPDPFGGETHEDVRIASLDGTAFLVLRPVVATHEGKTLPKQQVWHKMSSLRFLYVFETRAAADLFTTSQKASLTEFNPGYRPPQLEYLPHPASGDEPFNDKAVIVYFAKPEPAILATDLKLHSVSGQVFFSWSSDHLQGARVWKPVSIVDQIVVFDSLADARSCFHDYSLPPELKPEKTNSHTDPEQR